MVSRRPRKKAGLLPVKVNAVVKRGVNDHTMVDLARHFKGTGVIVRFIEFMDVGATRTVGSWKTCCAGARRWCSALIALEMPIEPAI